MTTLEAEKCIICYDGYAKEDVQTITFGCGHKFHSMCLLGWIDTIGMNDNTSRCPQCRQIVIKWPEHTHIQGAIQPEVRQTRRISCVLRPFLFMMVFLLLCTGSAFLTVQTEPTLISYDNTTQCAPTSSPPPLKFDVSLLTFIHNNYNLRYHRSVPGQLFHPELVIEAGLFYSSLYVIHIIDITLGSMSISAATILVGFATWDTKTIARRMDLLANLIEKEVLFFQRVLNDPPPSLVERQSILFDHTNRSGAFIRGIIEISITFLLYIANTLTIVFVTTVMQAHRMLHVFGMCDVMYPPEQILGLLGSSTLTLLEEIFCKYDGVISLRIFDGHPDIVTHLTPVALFILVTPLLNNFYDQFFPRN